MATPIFQLLRQIKDDDIGLRTMRLITKLGVTTVEGLAEYSVPYIKSQTANPDEVVNALAEILNTKYQLTFSQTYRSSRFESKINE